MPSRPGAKSRLDSWPPTQVRLTPTTPKDYPSLEDIDADPLTYFLTPAPDLEDMDEDVDMIDFDAGIESPGRSHDIVRSVSPSSLEGLAMPKSRMASPPVPELYETTMPDTDEEEEDYVRFAPPSIGLPRNPWGPKEIMTRSKTRSTAGPSMRLTAEALLSVSSPRGRSRATSGRGRDAASASLRRRGSHLWRSPSPDVWSIEEETEEEMLSELGSSVGPRSTTDGDRPETTRVDGKAAKPKKRVRFVLPGEEM
ncbi:hypothetical protein B0T11DRAFT_88534 [Plectosphaerella cucumerina]|uniref:Uncharacterized protein n=1 Tax=Plectosphaerella cucumerina TaxID=40658 RepID=A0A8K0TJZ2_9PEZI|nr:hypothetical protein B0T11DRAFT_88534 [Plectosphaerella cucumerina]